MVTLTVLVSGVDFHLLLGRPSACTLICSESSDPAGLCWGFPKGNTSLLHAALSEWMTVLWRASVRFYSTEQEISETSLWDGTRRPGERRC